MTRRDEIEEIIKERSLFFRNTKSGVESWRFLSEGEWTINNFIDAILESERQRIKPLVEALEYALKIKDLWLLGESVGLEHDSEAIALAMMQCNLEKALTEAKNIWD